MKIYRSTDLLLDISAASRIVEVRGDEEMSLTTNIPVIQGQRPLLGLTQPVPQDAWGWAGVLEACEAWVTPVLRRSDRGVTSQCKIG